MERIQESIDSIPEFYLNPPIDDSEYLYTTSSFISPRRETARAQATLLATTAMSNKIGSKVESLQRLFQEELTAGEFTNYSSVFTLATQQISSQKLQDSEQYKIEFQPTKDGKYECFVVIRVPTNSARNRIQNELSRDQEFYLRLKESKAFEELLNNLERIGE